MAATYKTPGVYIEEIPKLPPSIASVETAIPAFIGYTENAYLREPDDLRLVPHRISSMLEYELYFGYAKPEDQGILQVNINTNKTPVEVQGKATKSPAYLMYYSLQFFFANGGGPCYIVSVGNYSGGGVISDSDLQKGLDEVAKENEVTLILFPDSINLSESSNYYSLHQLALDQCKDLKDRFVVMDVWESSQAGTRWQDDVKTLRDGPLTGIDQVKYGAVYFPKVYTTLNYYYEVNGEKDYSLVTINATGNTSLSGSLKDLKDKDNVLFFRAKDAVDNIEMLLPASCGVVGKYADTDRTRGVWKAPANINLNLVTRPKLKITHNDQKDLNVDSQYGKSINVIRTFPGKGPAIIWGARTLAGNDNEWRYVPVRRLFNMVEESTKNAVDQFVFEPNDRNTWVRVKSMIENYLTQLWKAGALMGASVQEAFFVHVGLGETMIELDIWEGRMIVEIGLAAVRPAEFIILRFMHKMLSET